MFPVVFSAPKADRRVSVSNKALDSHRSMAATIPVCFPKTGIKLNEESAVLRVATDDRSVEKLSEKRQPFEHQK